MIVLPTTTTQAPGGRSLATMQSAVLSFLAVEPDDDNRSVAQFAINNGIDLLNTQRWRKIMSYQDIPLTAGTADYDLNPDFRDSRHSQFFDSDGNPVMPGSWCGYLDQKTFEQTYPSSTTTGTPTAYTVYYGARKLSLNVMPAQSFVTDYPTLRIRYYPSFQHLENASDVLDGVISGFSAFLIWYARWEVATGRGRHREASQCEGMWRQLLQQLKVDDNEILEDFN